LEADLNGQAVRAYDLEASLVRVDPTTANSSASVLSEHGLIQFGHSKGRDDLPQIQGLVLLLSIALRVLTLLEWVVRRRLLQGQEKLKGLYPGQPGRQTGRPSAELLLRAFRGISLVVEQVAGQLVRLLTPLNALQQRLLALLDLPGDLYARLELHFAEPPPH
jgi:transposase